MLTYSLIADTNKTLNSVAGAWWRQLGGIDYNGSVAKTIARPIKYLNNQRGPHRTICPSHGQPQQPEHVEEEDQR